MSTSGGVEANACARAVRELLAKVPISAVTKPAPPPQSKLRREIDEALELQSHVPNNMSESPRPRKDHCSGSILEEHGDIFSQLRPASPGDNYLSFSLFALGVSDFAAVCPRQLAVQSACAARQSFECTAYGMLLTWLSGGPWLMLHAINI